MTEDKIKNLLQKADQTAGPAMPVYTNLASVRRRAHQRHMRNIAAPVAAAAMILIAVGVWCLTTRANRTSKEQAKIASLETQLKQLQARTDATLSLITEVLEHERQQRRLAELEAKLASIPDPLEEIREELDKPAFVYVYQADRMYRDLNQKEKRLGRPVLQTRY
ncbi:MAG: hypothetical protein ACYS83_01370 [Planctomycetota bacterium]|jgi:DNA repair exonuclease SbcCD ATPase subunit